MADEERSLAIRISGSAAALRAETNSAASDLGNFEQEVEQALNKIENRFNSIRTENLSNSLAKVKADFRKNFTEIQQIAAQAIDAPLLSGGGLDLGSASTRAAAEAAAQKANATRLIAEAAERAMVSEGALARETEIYARAARQAAASAEQEARELAQKAGVLERVEIETRAAVGATTQLVQAQRRSTASAGQQRAGMQQLSYQIGDVAAQFATGTNPMIIFAQQGGQVIQAIALMQQEAKGFIGFMSGPWGAVIMGAVTILGLMASKHSDADKAAGQHKTAEDELKEAIDRMRASSVEANRQTELMIQQDIRAADAAWQAARAKREQAKAQLEAAKARISEAQAIDVTDPTGSRIPGVESGMASAAADAIQREIDALNQKIAVNARESVNLRGELVRRQVQARNDPQFAAQRQYENSTDRARQQFERTGDRGAYDAELDRAAKVREATLKTLQDARSATRASDRADAAAQRAAARAAERQTDQLTQQTGQLREQLILDGLRNQGARLEADLLQAEFDVRRQIPQLEGQTTAEYEKRIAAVIALRKEVAAQSAGADIMRNPLTLTQEAQQQFEADWKSMTEKAAASVSRLNERARELASTINDDLAYGLKGAIRGFTSLGDIALSVIERIGDSIIDNLLASSGNVGTGGVGGAIAGAVSSLLKFEGGGYTGNGATNAVAGVVHGREFVFDAAAVSRIGVPTLESIRNGSFRSPSPRMGPAANRGGDATVIHQTIQFSGAVDLATKEEVYRVADSARVAAMGGITERNRRRP